MEAGEAGKRDEKVDVTEKVAKKGTKKVVGGCSVQLCGGKKLESSAPSIGRERVRGDGKTTSGVQKG